MEHFVHALFCSMLLLQSTKSLSNLSSLVYNVRFINQTPTTSISPTSNNNSHSQTLSSLFQELISHSSQTKFFKTFDLINDDRDHEIALYALYQCRGDINFQDCYNCVIELPKMSNTLCGEAASCRIQLHGCYMHYEPDHNNGFLQHDQIINTKNELHHKICGESKGNFGGYEEKLSAAFEALEDGVLSSEDGYYSTRFESVQVMAQCEGDLDGCECGECVNNAAQIAMDECGEAASGEIYLEKCYLSFAWSLDGKQGNLYPEKEKNKSSTGKKVAIVLGGAAALGLGFIVFVFLKSSGKKDDV